MTSFSEITGLVDRAQNPDALLTDGARALTGHLSVASGITVDGVDISAFQSAYQAHLANPVAHSYVRNILDDSSVAVDRDVLTNDVRIYGADGISVTKTSTGLRISGSGGGGGGGSTFAGIKDPSGAAAVPDGFNYISLTVSNQVSITASTNALAFALVPGNINHQDLGGRGADDHHAAFVGLKVGATTVNPDGSDVITIAAGTNATVVAGSNTVTIGVSSTPAFTSVTVSGNISVGGTVDGVDISTHAANANAHHNQQHALAGGDHTASGLTAGQVLRASGSTTFAWAQLAHGDLSSIGTNTHAQIDTHIATGDTHVAHSGVTLTAGDGLTGGGTIAASRTFTLGTPTSLSATSTNSVTSTSHTHTIDATIARSAITISAGLGLTGGGDLTANRTIALSTPGSLSATSTNNATGNHTHVIDSSIARSAITIGAGNGLSGGGDLTANRTIALSTPGSLSATSTNSATGNHTHVIDSSIARSAITISAGDGLMGGGNLTANRTLAVNQDYDFNWTGLHTFGEHTEMESVDVNGALTVFGDLSVFHGGFYPLYVNVDTVNPNNSNVGIMTNTPDPQFALDVAGPLRAQYLIGPHAIQLSDAAMIAHYDGPYPFETNFDGFAAGHLGQVATTTGGVIYRPGKFGKAVQLAEATTNLVTNPSFEVSTTGWVNYSNGAATGTRERVSEDSKYGGHSYKLVKTGGATTDRWGTRIGTQTVTVGQTFTWSAWVNVTEIAGGSQAFAIYMEGSALSGVVISRIYGVTDGWQRITLKATAANSGSLLCYLWIDNADTATVYVDGVQLEQKAYATPYCDGSLGTGHTWSGTAHASTSSRTAAHLSYTITGTQAASWTMMAWIKSSGWNNSGSYGHFLSLYGPTSARVRVYTASGNAGGVVIEWVGNTASPLYSVLGSAGKLSANAWHHLAFTYNGTSLSLYIDGVLSGSATLPVWSSNPNSLLVGKDMFSSAVVKDVLYDDLVILNRAASADEIRAIYESDAPVFAESSIEVWRTPTQVPIWVDSEGLWMRAVGGGETLGAYGGDATKSWGGKTLYQSDFLLGNATDGYIHWHAFQDDSDPWGAAGMEVKAEMDIIGNSTVSGVLSVTGEFSVIDGTTKLFVTQDYLLAGNAAGVDETSFAVIFANGTIVGTSPSSPTYDAGDVLIGDELNTNILWDQSAGRMNFRNGTTVEAYVDDGAIVAGLTRMDSDGITINAPLSMSYTASSSIDWKYNGNLIGDLWIGSDVSAVGVYLESKPIAGKTGEVSIRSQTPYGYQANASLFAISDGVSASISLASLNGATSVQITGDTTLNNTLSVVGSAWFSSYLMLDEQTFSPSYSPASGTQAQVYMRGDKFIIAYNDGGTMRYKYLPLTGTSVTWVHTTAAP